MIAFLPYRGIGWFVITVMIVAYLFICRYVGGGRGSALRGCAYSVPCFY